MAMIKNVVLKPDYHYLGLSHWKWKPSINDKVMICRLCHKEMPYHSQVFIAHMQDTHIVKETQKGGE